MIEIIIITLLLSTFLNILLKKLDLPTIIWYIATGFLIAYMFWLHEVNNNHDLQLIAEFWIVFLMFTIWLEFSFSSFMKMKKVVFIYWWLQFIVTSSIFFIISYFLFSISLISSVIISMALSLSSTAIVLKLLNENNNINKSYWHKALWILLFQDLAVIPIMILITILSSQDSSIITMIWETIIGWIILITVLLFIWKFLLDYILTRVSKTNSNEIFISAILTFILWASYLAHFLGLSYSLWALIWWIMIAETHFKHRVESDLIPFRDLLLWIFFITVWMQLNTEIIQNNFLEIIILLLTITLIKVWIIYSIIKYFTKKIISLRTAFTLFQVWEFAIVLLWLATTNNLIDKDLSQTIIVTTIISMILTPIVLKNLDYIVWIFIKDNFIPENDLWSEKPDNHIIIIWHWRIWSWISNKLDEKKEKYYIIENDIQKFKNAKKQWKPIFYWDASKWRILNILNIEKAKYILVTIRDSKKLFQVCELLSHIVPKAKIIIKVNDSIQKSTIESLNLTNIVFETEEVADGMIRKMKLEKST